MEGHFGEGIKPKRDKGQEYFYQTHFYLKILANVVPLKITAILTASKTDIEFYIIPTSAII